MFTDKAIYQIPVIGTKYDPLELKRKLTIHSAGRLSELIGEYNDGDTELARAVAEDSLVKAARLAFDLKRITEGNGVSDSEVLAYLAHYLEWLSRPSDVNTKPYQTSRPCTDCPPPRTT